LKDDSNHEVLVLKERKVKGREDRLIDYGETSKTRKLRQQIQHLNKFLREASVELLATVASDGTPIDPSRRTLTRTFNNGSWTEGGRLSGGFWMNVPRTDRFRLFRIGGEPVANVDYGQLFPRLAYARAWCDPPSGDLYDGLGEGDRRGWKTLVNALLFTTKPLRSWPENTLEHFPHGTKLAACIAAIRCRHKPIAKLFGTGIGYTLMHTESEMLIAALEGLYRSGIVALPLHDSVLVGRSHAETASAIMQATAKRFTGIPRVAVEIDRGEGIVDV
jgi:hypothetical protein